MKKSTTRFRSRFEERPNAPPDAAAPFRVAQEAELERLKERLLREVLGETSARPDLNLAYRRAANEAASLAWLSPFPLLLFPGLFAERASEARERAERQRDLLTRTARCGTPA
jgi:hypothetical protein